ncbi:MAG TPA: hypothetical protein VID31_17480, partial [Streptosporangiaceae bacterium]
MSQGEEVSPGEMGGAGGAAGAGGVASRLRVRRPVSREAGPRPPGLRQPGPGWPGPRRGAGTRKRQLPPAGGAFARLTVLPAVLVMAWLVPGLPLLLAGVFSPAVMLLISVPLAIIIVSSGLHWVPAQWPTAFPGPRRGSRWPAWFGLAGTALVAVGFGVWQQAVNSVTIVASRAPGAAFAAGYWISQHGSLPIPARMG